jgi:hypothetical protein
MSNEIPRRNFLSRSLFAFATAMAAPSLTFSESFKKAFNHHTSSMNPILSTKPLGFQWETADPFLFCVHHEDNFPQGNEKWRQIQNI